MERDYSYLEETTDLMEVSPQTSIVFLWESL